MYILSLVDGGVGRVLDPGFGLCLLAGVEVVVVRREIHCVVCRLFILQLTVSGKISIYFHPRLTLGLRYAGEAGLYPAVRSTRGDIIALVALSPYALRWRVMARLPRYWRVTEGEFAGIFHTFEPVGALRYLRRTAQEWFSLHRYCSSVPS